MYDILGVARPSFFMKKIKIIDNFLSVDDLNIIMKNISGSSWTMQSSNVGDSSSFLMYNVSNKEFFNNYLYKKVASTLKKDVKLERVYFNGQYWCRDGNIHTDGCDITALIYITPYSPGLGGFTEILKGNDHHIIAPYQRRLVLFPGKWKHKGYAYSQQNVGMRISLAYKLNLI